MIVPALPFPRLELIFLFQVTGDRELLRSDQAAAEQNYFCNCSIKKRARVSLRTAKFNCPARLGRRLKRRGRCGQGRNALNSIGGDEKLRIVSVLPIENRSSATADVGANYALSLQRRIGRWCEEWPAMPEERGPIRE